MERKATDILIDLERKIEQLLGYKKTEDLNQKLILDRLNKLLDRLNELLELKSQPNSAVVKPQPSSAKLPSVGAYVEPTPPIAMLPSGKNIISAKNEFEFVDVDEEGNEQLKEDLQPLGRRDIRTPVSQGKKTQVQQKIIYPDGKNVILANVEVYTMVPGLKGKSEKKIAKQTRTNSSGKWAAALDPGKYYIHVFKSATNNKPIVELNYEVEITLSDTTLELEPKG